jgi:ATP-dependent Lon protease
MSELKPVDYNSKSIPEVLPVLPLRGMVAFPLAVVPLTVSHENSIRLIDDVMRDNRLALLVAQRNESIELPGPKDIYHMGTVAIIHQLSRSSGGNLRIIIQGLERAQIMDFTTTDPYLIAKIKTMPDHIAASLEVDALRWAVLNLFQRLVDLSDELSDELVGAAKDISNVRQLAYLIALAVPLTTKARQQLLETNAVDEKLRRLIELLQHEISVRELSRKITSETQGRMSEDQRKYYLREQMRSIQKELGESGEQNDSSEMHKRIEEANLPEEAFKEAQRELDRLSNLPPSSSEYGMIRSYLDWMASLPWNKLTGSVIDVTHAKQVLNEDHYDLEKVKDRILEYLAVKKLRSERQENGKKKSDKTAASKPEVAHDPILCFVGPPGVGKTSLGQSIARAMGREFVRISLGGLSDEAEIRGHRRTYIGAMPGRIIQSLKRAGSRDPVFMLDEIDKVGSNWRGDPSSALLEVLDPSQNQAFVDNYLGVSFDLSQVLFIATANNLDTIPAPLLDRMEVLRLSGYIDEEKLHIAERYLVPKQVKAHGLKADELVFNAEVIKHIIRRHTREAGVRNLDREIANVCRKVAREFAEGRKEPVALSIELIDKYLGRPKFVEEVAERTSRPGIATGLAWTPTGGDVLFVEAALMPSHEERLILTGMLGDVMRESAQAALSYLRSNAVRLKVDPQTLENKAIHLHVPAGAIPKDGPSAGVTMVTALVSLVTKRLVRNNLAMTGEITLRGKVLPVGGIKEKVLAAQRAGIKIVILPRQNEADLDDIPKELREQMEYIPVDTIDEVLHKALEKVKAK